MTKKGKRATPDVRFRKIGGSAVRGGLSEYIYTVEQVAKKLQVSPRTVRWWLKEGRLVGFKLGRLWRIKEEELVRFLEQTGKNPA